MTAAERLRMVGTGKEKGGGVRGGGTSREESVRDGGGGVERV